MAAEQREETWKLKIAIKANWSLLFLNMSPISSLAKMLICTTVIILGPNGGLAKGRESKEALVLLKKPYRSTRLGLCGVSWRANR